MDWKNASSSPQQQTKFFPECGTLVVPESWGKVGSRLIALPVVRIPASPLMAVMVLLPALLILGIVLVACRIRKRRTITS